MTSVRMGAIGGLLMIVPFGELESRLRTKNEMTQSWGDLDGRNTFPKLRLSLDIGQPPSFRIAMTS